MRPAILIAVLLSAGIRPTAAQAPTPERSGRRSLLPRAEEVALARSAAPAAISARARVLALADSGYVTADSGSNGVTCVVNRSWPRSIEPHCYDEEGAASILPMELRRTELLHRGASTQEADREIAAGLASGRFRLPRRPSLTYMMSSAQVLYDDEGRHVGSWRPHVMLYYPYLTNAAFGLGEVPGMTVSEQGSPFSTLILVMPAFASPAQSVTR
jgi:hypothetical protein